MSDASKLCPVCTQSWSAADHTPCFKRCVALSKGELLTLSFSLGLYITRILDDPMMNQLTPILATLVGADIILDEAVVRNLGERLYIVASELE